MSLLTDKRTGRQYKTEPATSYSQGFFQTTIEPHVPKERDGSIVYGNIRFRPVPVWGKHLPTAPAERKKIPLYSGLLKYFPDALVEVAHVSYIGNQQHNPGEPLHWAREKSQDQEDTIMRHLLESGTIDSDGVRHSAKVAWRALAMLQLEIEKERAKLDDSSETNSQDTSIL